MEGSVCKKETNFINKLSHIKMCIRDSISIKDTRGIIDAILSGAINEAPTKKIPYFDFEVPTALPGVDPVSYTHLDVYKRQVQRRHAYDECPQKFR